MTTPSATPHEDRHNRKVGMILFLIYFAFYVGFVAVIYNNYQVGARPSLFGLNLAIVYGFGLIFSAFALSLLYMVLAKKN